jgi:hypothetical protein
MGGLVMGLLSALPIVNVGNVCCCMWVVSGGLVAAFIFQQNQATPMTPADGALAGLLAGIAGAAIHLVVSIPIDIVMGPMERAMMQRVLDMAGTVPPEMRGMLDRLATQNDQMGIIVLLVRRMVAFLFMLFAGAIFSTLGGLLGAVLFKKSPTPIPES